MPIKAALTGLMLLVLAGGAGAQTATSGPTDRPAAALFPSRPNASDDDEIKQRGLRESEARDRRRESRMRRVMGSVCGRC